MVEIAIRQFKEGDAKEFQAAVLESVEHFSEWLPWCTPAYSIQDATDWANSASHTWREGTDYRFLIEDAETGRILGSVGINQVIAQHKQGNLGYWVCKSAINYDICTRYAGLQRPVFTGEMLFHCPR